jgi:hypothetical protein
MGKMVGGRACENHNKQTSERNWREETRSAMGGATIHKQNESHRGDCERFVFMKTSVIQRLDGWNM